MQVSVQTLNGLERQITVAVPAEKIETEIKTRLNSLSKRARISGFRPGKAPMHVIKQHYGDQVQQEVMGEVLESSFYEAVVKEKLRPAGSPHIHPKSREPGQPLEYTATFEIYPEVSLNPFSGIEIERPTAEITEADVDRVLENIRKQRMEWSAVERASIMGDRVLVDFKGLLEGGNFPGNEAQNMPVELGKQRMIPGFEEHLTGVSSGAQLSFTVRFPADYHRAEMADKDVQFEVKVNAVEEARLPEISEEFVRSLGVADATVESLRKDVRQNMQRELDDRIQTKLKQNVMDALFKSNPITVPKALVQQEVHTLMQNQNIAQSASNSADQITAQSRVEEFAQRRVGLALILSEIVRQQSFKVEPKKLREAVEHFASTYEKPDEVVQWYYADKKRLGEVESYVLENEVVAWVAAQARMKDVSSSFDALIKQGQTA
ncbi:MAG: trigger factor [Gammaproteobacteria bacterium]|nr:trigger factor [Gammaproteobacteria bacterium]